MTIGSPMLAIKRTPADHDTQVWVLGPRCVKYEFDIFIMGGIIVAI